MICLKSNIFSWGSFTHDNTIMGKILDYLRMTRASWGNRTHENRSKFSRILLTFQKHEQNLLISKNNHFYHVSAKYMMRFSCTKLSFLVHDSRLIN